MKHDFSSVGENGWGLMLDSCQREALWHELRSVGEKIIDNASEQRVFDPHAQTEVADSLLRFDFNKRCDPLDVLGYVADSLFAYQLNTSHPCYFGVFNPTPSTMGIIADSLVAHFNPQLASTMSSKWCIGLEDKLIQYFGRRFGYDENSVEGMFTTGASEANYTALLCALHHYLPSIAQGGLIAATQRPLVYCTHEAHNSIARAVRICGLGTESLRLIGVDDRLKINLNQLDETIKRDRALGFRPLFIVATLGSTSAGVIDPITEMAEIAQRHDVWLHVDAAWGGAIALLPEFSDVMSGVSLSDSIAFDPHKWLSVPMGCGMFITRHQGIMRRSFDVEQSFYMPKETRETAATEPYRQSMQWSRRFIGLKLYMTLAVHGEEGYREILRHQIAMGKLLRSLLTQSDWLIKNHTPLPVICFVDERGLSSEEVKRAVVETKRAFITTTQLSLTQEQVIRAGIASFLTVEEHVRELVEILNDTRDALTKF